MACDELLVHTDDAARGLGSEFYPDSALAGRVLARLFPWHDPWQTLLWANGRIDLPGRRNQAAWAWHCAPIAEWDGTPPRILLSRKRKFAIGKHPLAQLYNSPFVGLSSPKPVASST
jgi:hypothetical protein